MRRCTTLARVLITSLRPLRPLISARVQSAPSRRLHMCSFRRSDATPAAEEEPARDELAYDVVVVGGGPAGLSCAIRLKQQCVAANKEVSICVLDKGAEIGSHILSGNVFDPIALDELLPGWRKLDDAPPVRVCVNNDKMHFLTSSSAIPLPIPPSLHNKGNYIISLGELTKWLGQHAESLGIDIFPGFSGASLLYSSSGAVRGVRLRDVGLDKSGARTAAFQPGADIVGKQTVLAEGARGSLSEQAMARFELRSKAGADPQTYGLGIKEIWEVAPSKFQQGTVAHTIGWPSNTDTWSGTFCYHLEDNKVLLGMVIGLDYSNAYTSPYREFQKLKHHPHFASLLEGGKCLQYGARVINEGGFQSIPHLTFPGGVLVGCAAGFLNVPRIKGTHTAMKSGMVAADALFAEINNHDAEALAEKNIEAYQRGMEQSWVWRELHQVRNIHPAFHALGGLFPWMLYSALESFVFKGKTPWTFRNKIPDHERTKPISECTPIDYPKPDGVLSFDLLTNLQRANVAHNESQPSHLRIKPGQESVPISVSHAKFGAPETRFCPARVYEVVEEEGKQKMQINNTNCVHCKSCAIKTPQLYIDWTVPEGGGGPNYTGM